MKVAIVCPYDLGRFGGVQDQVVKLSGWLQDEGHQAWVVGPGTSGPPDARLVGPVTVVPANGAATPISLNKSAWRRTAEAVAGADVIHIHEPFMPVVSTAALWLEGPPKVGTFHADPSQTVRRVYRWGGPAFRALAKRLTVVTAVSPVAGGAISSFVNFRLVPNGIDVHGYRTAGKDPNRIVFVGRDDPRKGLDVLLEAWPDVRKQVPSAELIVAGTSRDRVGQGVHFAGRVSESEKRDLLTSAAIFCAPNIGGESFGIILAEAMASGCAIVASGLPAFVHVAGASASIVSAGDSGGLANTLVQVLTNETERARLSEAALARVGRFDRRAVVDGYLEAYKAAASVQL